MVAMPAARSLATPTTVTVRPTVRSTRGTLLGLRHEFIVTRGNIDRHSGDRTTGGTIGRFDHVLEESDEMLEYLRLNCRNSPAYEQPPDLTSIEWHPWPTLSFPQGSESRSNRESSTVGEDVGERRGVHPCEPMRAAALCTIFLRLLLVTLSPLTMTSVIEYAEPADYDIIIRDSGESKCQ